MIKTHSYEDRQSLLETGGEYKKQNNNNYNKNRKRQTGGWVGQRRAEMLGVDGGAVGVRGGVCWCVSLYVVFCLEMCMCIHVAEVRRN